MNRIPRFLKKPYAGNVISIISILLSTLMICIGFYFTNETIKASFEVEKVSNRIEITKELPLKTTEFIRSATLAFGYKIIYSNTLNNEDKINLEKQDMIQSKLLDEIQPLVVSYGTEKTLLVFNEFYLPLRDKVNSKSYDIEEFMTIYFPLPLFMSLTKYDSTGEIVNPKIMYELLMPEFMNMGNDTTNKFKLKNNELVTKLKLPTEFIWNDYQLNTQQ